MSIAVEIAQKLTPAERNVLGRAGAFRWFGLPHPWQPTPSQVQLLRRHLHGVRALFAPVPTYLGAYTLTPLGEQVAAVFLMAVLEEVQQTEWLAGRLTPLQRSVLCLVATLGDVTALELDSFQYIVVASALANPEYGLLDTQDFRDEVHFTLTPLGDAVVEELLVGVQHD
ncbi:MAG: hypothetical protein H0X24_00995 [Ktedonobacterales bacterium]|nr:hypothetical protein [Ktedonobacterales bacterium]